MWEQGEGGFERKKVLLDIRHLTLEIYDLGVENKKLKFMRKNSESHSQSHSESYYWNLSYFIQKVSQKVM